MSKTAANIFVGTLFIFLTGLATAETLTIKQNPGVRGETIQFIANGELTLGATDTVAEFIVDFSPDYLSNPLGDIGAYSSFRTVDWGVGQDLSSISITEYVSDGRDQVVPIADFEPVTTTETGYMAGDVPFPAPFPFALREFGVRIEGLQPGSVVTFTKDAQTLGRGGGIVLPEPASASGGLLGVLCVFALIRRNRCETATVV